MKLVQKLMDEGAELNITGNAGTHYNGVRIAEVYDDFDGQCLAAARGHPRIVGAWLQSTRAWPNAPWNAAAVWDIFRDESGQPFYDEETGEVERELIASTIELGDIHSF